MGKSAKNRHRFSSRQLRSAPYPTSQPYCWEECNSKKPLLVERKDWEESTCSVCMEFPHNAVLLLCSSHDNGCRPYMCGTSHRHSNCLDQFKKAYTKVMSVSHDSSLGENPRWSSGSDSRVFELSCPLCRGQVKGWTVVEPARKYLNDKKRSCMENDCSFMGAYKELKKHVKSEHPSARPREINPEMVEKWRVLELESERQDVMSTVMSSMPRSMVFGDYVIEMTNDRSVAGAGEDDGGDEDSSSSLNRNILYVMREGARLMRLQWDITVEEGGGGFDPLVDGVDGDTGDADAVVTSDLNSRRGEVISRADSRNRRRRRRNRPAGGHLNLM